MLRRSIVWVALLGCASCAPPRAANPPVSPAAVAVETPVERGSSCQRDIPDCAAACALRETDRREHLTWFDRRCAAVVLGKNPDKAVGYSVPALSADESPSAAGSSRSWQLQGDYDPFVRRLGPAEVTEPVECRAARALPANGRSTEAAVLSALCFAKGGAEPPALATPASKPPESPRPAVSPHNLPGRTPARPDIGF